MMKLNLQYFASAADSNSASSGVSNDDNSKPSESAKYTQSQVNKMMSEKSDETFQTVTQSYAASLKSHDASVSARATSLAQLNATQLASEKAKESSASMSAAMSELNSWRAYAANQKAMSATNKALNANHVDNVDEIAPLLTSTDVNAQNKNIHDFNNWLKQHDEALKNKILKGSAEPQNVSTMDTGQTTSSSKNFKDMNITQRLIWAQQHPDQVKSHLNHF